jgi:hypothetical protein
MASCTKSPKICCHSPPAAVKDFHDSDATSTTSSASSSESAMAGAGGLQPQPAAGEVLEMMGEEISHIDQQEHHRNIKIPYGSLDPAATIAGSALKGSCIPCSIDNLFRM